MILKDKKPVLIADEAHHLDNENDNERTWWKTVQNLFKTNNENILLGIYRHSTLTTTTTMTKSSTTIRLKALREDKYPKR